MASGRVPLAAQSWQGNRSRTRSCSRAQIPTVETKGKAPGNIESIVKAIEPAVVKSKKTCASQEKASLVECAIDANVRQGQALLTEKSAILKHLVAEGKLRIVGAKYDLDDGKVTVFENK